MAAFQEIEKTFDSLSSSEKNTFLKGKNFFCCECNKPKELILSKCEKCNYMVCYDKTCYKSSKWCGCEKVCHNCFDVHTNKCAEMDCDKHFCFENNCSKSSTRGAVKVVNCYGHIHNRGEKNGLCNQHHGLWNQICYPSQHFDDDISRDILSLCKHHAYQRVAQLQ